MPRPDSIDPSAAKLAIAEAVNDSGIAVIVSRAGAEGAPNLHVSRGAAELFGYGRGELLEIPASRLTADEAVPGSTVRHEAVALRKDGSRRPVEVLRHQLESNDGATMVTFFFDVTERREATNALAQSEARFRAVVENAPDGVVILRGKTILYLNMAAATMLGYERPEDAVGASIADLLHPEDAPIAADRIAVLMQKRERLMGPTEYRSRRKDGSELTAEISSIPIVYEGAPAVLAFARDVTERKAIQAQLVQADRLAALGTLAAGVAHEINNPLTYVLLGLRYVERELATLGGDPTRTARLMARIRESQLGAERVSAIVRDLKAFARFEEDSTGPVDVLSVLEVALKLAENEIRHRARLVRTLGAVPIVHGNAARLEQVFLNLLVNAAQALPAGDPTRDEIHVSARTTDNGWALVSVRDTGCGIPEHIRGRIFDPFFTTKPVGVGTGLGLAICQGIVSALGGRIDVESAPERGTTVSVVLPKHETTFHAAESSRPSGDEVPSERGRVLVIDDEPFVGRLLGNLLGAAHDVRVTVSAKEALEALGAASFDAILCDLMMPGMSGMEFYEEVARRQPGLETRIIFMTGGAFVQKIADFATRVPNVILDKPFEVDAVLVAIRKTIDRAESA